MYLATGVAALGSGWSACSEPWQHWPQAGPDQCPWQRQPWKISLCRVCWGQEVREIYFAFGCNNVFNSLQPHDWLFWTLWMMWPTSGEIFLLTHILLLQAINNLTKPLFIHLKLLIVSVHSELYWKEASIYVNSWTWIATTYYSERVFLFSSNIWLSLVYPEEQH